MDQLSDDDISAILYVNVPGNRKRKAGNQLTPKYRNKMLKDAEGLAENWNESGVPQDVFKRIVKEKPSLIQKFGWKVQSLTNDQPCVDLSEKGDQQLFTGNEQESNQYDPLPCGSIQLEIPVNSSATDPYRNAEREPDVERHDDDPIPGDEYTSSEWEDVEEDNVWADGPHRTKHLKIGSVKNRMVISYKRLLQHYFASIKANISDVTEYLRLFKYYKPKANYNDLPCSGKTLLKISGRDFGSQENKLPAAMLLGKSGKYIHFGLEKGLSGKSPGDVFQNAGLLQFVALHKQDPLILPTCLRQQIEALDDNLQIAKALKVLKGDGNTGSNPDAVETANVSLDHLPHFEIEINIDGIEIAKNSENNGSATPILARIYSVKKSYCGSDPPYILHGRRPFIVGFYVGKEKPDISKFTAQLLDELIRLDPGNDDESITSGRQFTASIRCFICDTPMRCYLKRCKYSNGYWACERCVQKGEPVRTIGQKKKQVQMLDVDAPRRINEDFLTYCVGKDSLDDHLPKPEDESPFVTINFPMVTGFVTEPMHTFFAGAFSRRLNGIARKRHEGRVTTLNSQKMEEKLRLFQKWKPCEFDRDVRSLVNCGEKYKFHELRQFLYYLLFPVFEEVLTKDQLVNILRLQYAMLLLGSYDPNPVLETNINKASDQLKLYVKELIGWGYPIRMTTHLSIHIPDDVREFLCGVECISAFQFESFMSVFQDLIHSGHLIPEQIRNRLAERSKYLLPRSADGLLLSSAQEFEIEGKRLEASLQKQNVLVEFVDRKPTSKLHKMLRFTNFSISTKLGQNVCVLKSGTIVVIRDIIEQPVGSGEIFLVAHKFKSIYDAFDQPFRSSDFGIHICTNINKEPTDYNIDCLSGKVYHVPYKLKAGEQPDIFKASQRWYVTPIRHTLL